MAASRNGATFELATIHLASATVALLTSDKAEVVGALYLDRLKDATDALRDAVELPERVQRLRDLLTGVDNLVYTADETVARVVAAAQLAPNPSSAAFISVQPSPVDPVIDTARVNLATEFSFFAPEIRRPLYELVFGVATENAHDVVRSITGQGQRAPFESLPSVINRLTRAYGLAPVAAEDVFDLRALTDVVAAITRDPGELVELVYQGAVEAHDVRDLFEIVADDDFVAALRATDSGVALLTTAGPGYEVMASSPEL